MQNEIIVGVAGCAEVRRLADFKGISGADVPLRSWVMSAIALVLYIEAEHTGDVRSNASCSIEAETRQLATRREKFPPGRR